ncbi:MAG: MATE family efflux transporter [Clostridia bacterium]|nr:MATE family efflux transporter [Clostridia bacterium]
MINFIKTGLPYFRRMLIVAVPIMLQSGITNFVSMLDNIMVGQVGTLQMSGVSIVNQLMFIFNLCIFGAMSGAGIFTAQFYGKKDDSGVKNTVQYKFISCLLLTAIGIAAFVTMGDRLIGAYLQGEAAAGERELVAQYSAEYLRLMLPGLLPFALSQVYAGTLRETNDRIIPLISTVTAVIVNLVLNYILIFGHFGAPAMGINGAAIATVIARYTELAVLVVWVHTHKKKYPFVKGLFTSSTLTAELLKKITLISTPLLINEALWSAGMAMLNQCYSVRGLDVVAAANITSTISNVFNVAFISFGSAIGIILSQMLGAGEKEKARKASTRLLFFAVFTVVFIAVIMIIFAPAFPKIYKTSDEIRSLASTLIILVAAFMPVQSFTNACYFTLRSGGKTVITFLFDSGFVWTISVPLAFILSRFTSVPIVPMYAIIFSADIIKCVLGYIFMKKGVWLNRVVE